MAAQTLKLNGKSTPRRITIESDRFKATAYAGHSGNITCEVRPVLAIRRYLADHPRIPVPLTAKFVLFMADDRHAMAKILERTIASVMAELIRRRLAQRQPSIHCSSSQARGLATIADVATSTLRTATWHGAEHMAIAAYNDTGAADMEHIKRQSPVHKRCGTRFLVPMLTLRLVGRALAKTGLSRTIQWCLVLAAAEAFLRLDKCWGDRPIPGLDQASTVLQRYITTRQPGELELRAAQRALQELLAAHTQNSYLSST